jgi:hypothetical protein
MNKVYLRWMGVAIAALALEACTDEGEDDTTGAVGPGVGGGPSTAGTGGASAGGGGGGGAAPLTCQPDSIAAADFAIARTDLCVLAKYDAPTLDLPPYGATPSWGSHGGPLTYEADTTSATIYRWSLTGTTLTAATSEVTLTNIPAGAFFGPQVVDPLGVATFSWTGASFTTEGGIVVDDLGSGLSTTTIGVFGLAATPARLFYTGLSSIGGALGDNALYAGHVIVIPEEVSLAADGEIDAWGLASGPVATDGDANVFAFLTDYTAGTQELRGYAAASVELGDPAVVGVALATLDGYGDAMAAMAPSGTKPGLVLFQPNDASTSAHLDVMALEYGTPGGVVTPGGAPAAALTLTTADTNTTLMTDDQDRLWVGVPDGSGGSRVYVIGRK